MEDKIIIGVRHAPDKLLAMIKNVLPEAALTYMNDKESEYVTVDYDSSDIVTRVKLSDLLAYFMIEQFEKQAVAKIITEDYGYFSRKERAEILEHLEEILKSDKKRYAIVLNAVFDYFDKRNKLMVEGFLNFRLYKYKEELNTLVEAAIEGYIAKKEYDEFIKLLKYFVDTQESLLESMHVIPQQQWEYKLLDDLMEDVTEDCILNFMTELPMAEINPDDMLISALIALSPKIIYIHRAERIQNKELLETVEKVFEGKVKYCSGCEHCAK